MIHERRPAGGPSRGYGGMYEISDMGDVRSWRWRGTRRASSPHLLQPFVRKQGRKGRALFVKLTDADGKGTDAKVLSLMVDTWMGGKRPGLVPYHKNGDLKDNWVGNIGFASRKELGRKTGASAGPEAGSQGRPGGRDRGSLFVRPGCGQGQPHELSDGAGPVQREGEEAICTGRAHLSI